MTNPQRQFWIEERDRALAAIERTERKPRTMATVDALDGFRRDAKQYQLALDSVNGCTDDDYRDGCRPHEMRTASNKRAVAFAFDAESAERILRESVDGLTGSASLVN